MLTLEQIEALENYVMLGRKPSGDADAKEKFRSAKEVLDKAGLTQNADAISRGHGLADTLCQLARERLTAGTFQQGLNAADKVSPTALYDISVRFGVSYEELMEMFGHIRNLKQEASNGLEQVFSDLAAKQQPLDPEFGKVWADNDAQLYERDTPPKEKT